MKCGLIVDDSKVVRTVSRRIIESLGFKAEEAADGQQALDFCKVQLPDFIILDWNMPVMDGITFLGHFRTLPGNEKTTVIFCSTENDIAHIQRGLSAGANEYIMKPFDVDIIKDKLVQTGVMDV